jgi:predicted membrane protein
LIRQEKLIQDKPVIKFPQKMVSQQGDQTGRIFANLVIVYSGQFVENFKSRPSFNCFFHIKRYVLISTKLCWATFWAIFATTHLVTLFNNQKSQNAIVNAKKSKKQEQAFAVSTYERTYVHVCIRLLITV